MKFLNSFLTALFAALLLVTSCKNEKKEERSDIDMLRQSTNKKSYPAAKMDSAQAITAITTQKVQELLDLSTLYVAGNRDTEIDSVIYSQMKSYFHKPDSLTFKPMLKELESLKVNSAKVHKLEVYKKIHGKDTLDLTKFDVEYFDKNANSISKSEKNAQFILVSKPIQFKKEFKFYFLNFYSKPLNDSISSGVIK